jgi:hypothetical protein
MRWSLPPRGTAKTVSDLVGEIYVISLPWRRERLRRFFKDYGSVLGSVTVVDDAWDCLDAWRSRSAMKSGILFLNGGCLPRHPGQTVTVNPMKTFFTAECYLISRGLSKVLLDDWDRVGIQHAVDMSIWFFIRRNRPSTHGFATDVPLAGQRPGLPSDISKSHAKN